MSGIPVLHGIDMAGLSSARPARGNWASQFYETDTRGKRVWDETEQEWLPEDYIAGHYKFANDGGAVGFVGLSRVRIPAGTIIVGALIDVVTTFTSAADTATVALSVEAANDIVSAVAINDGGNPWDAGLHAGVPDWTAANAIKATKDRDLRVTIGVQALTAGEMYVFLKTLRSFQTVTEEESSSSSTSSNSSSSTSSNSSSSSSST